MAGRTRAAYDILRARIPFLDEDRYLSPDIEGAADILAAGRLLV
jgi:histidine ammonia-lyase